MKNANNFEHEIISLEQSLSRYAYSLTLDPDDAKDLVQETYYKALNNQDKFDTSTNLKAWLYTIMKNTFINDYRRRVKKQAIFNKDVQEFVINSKPATSTTALTAAPAQTFRTRHTIIPARPKAPRSQGKTGFLPNSVFSRL